MPPKVYKHQCEHRVSTGFLTPPYDRKHECEGSVERNGKWHCRRHDPVAIKAKQYAHYAESRARWAAKEEANRRQAALAKACEGLSTEALEAGVVGMMRDVCMAVLQAHEQSRGLDILDGHIRALEDRLVRIRDLLHSRDCDEG